MSSFFHTILWSLQERLKEIKNGEKNQDCQAASAVSLKEFKWYGV